LKILNFNNYGTYMETKEIHNYGTDVNKWKD
jgi:hypothetical protein